MSTPLGGGSVSATSSLRYIMCDVRTNGRVMVRSRSHNTIGDAVELRAHKPISRWVMLGVSVLSNDSRMSLTHHSS